jgi:hypothetical protein
MRLEPECRLEVLIRTVADHDCVAVVERGHVDRQIGDRPHQVVNDDQ